MTNGNGHNGTGISRPELQSAALGIYVLRWATEGIEIRIDRIVESHNEVSGEITVRSTNPGITPHLHQARLNLTSTVARRTLGKALSARLTLDWDAVLEQACVLTIQAYRIGEPVVEVGNQPRETTPSWLLHPLLRRGQPTLLYGAGKTGKSYIGALCGLLVQEGRAAVGLTPYPDGRPRCLYLDYEASREELNVRVGALAAGLDLDPTTHLLYRRCYQTLAVEAAEIRRWIMEYHVSFIVVDSLGLACGGDPEAAASILPYFAALRSLGVTSLTIHHLPKDAERGPYGSVYTTNMSRSAWEVKRAQEAGENSIDVGLYHRFVNNGRTLPPLGITFTFEGTDPDGDPDIVRVSRQNVLDVPVLAAGAPLKDRIADSLRGGGRTVQDLAAELGATDTVIRGVLNRHRELFTNLSPAELHPRWGLRTI